jgi:hypothetical protein
LDQGEKLSARVLLLEDSYHGRGHGRGVLLLYTSHHHAEVPCLDHYAYTLGINRILNGIGYLPGEPLLYSTSRGILLRPMTLLLGI